MYGIEEYGITADERLKLAAYKAGYKAHNITSLLAFAGFLTLLALGEETGAIVLGVVNLVGINLYEYLVGKEGWEQFVLEEIEHRPGLRKHALKRELRFAFLSAIYFGCFTYFMSDHRSILMSLIAGIFIGTVSFVFSWRQRIRPRRQRSDLPATS
jgi:hypothetical protein